MPRTSVLRLVAVLIALGLPGDASHLRAICGSPGGSDAQPAVVSATGLGEGASRLSVMGKIAGGTAYKLALEYVPGSSAGDIAAVLVSSSPSMTLLVAHWDPKLATDGLRELISARKPLVSTEGTLGESQPRVLIPWAPGKDDRILVELLHRNGFVELVSAAKVKTDDFSFTTRFNGPTENREVRHCCACGGCDQMCIDCDGAYFTRDCIACSISCLW